MSPSRTSAAARDSAKTGIAKAEAARTGTRPRLGLVLGSGSARGWAHIGILQELQTAGIHPDIVVGSSIGALVGGAYVSGGLDRLTDWALTFNRLDALRTLDLRIANGGLLGGGRLMRRLLKPHHNEAIESLSPRFACVATDLATGLEIALQEGPLAEGVLASLAMPGLFAPVKRDSQWLVDGGIVDPVPVTLARALGAERVIAVNLTSGMANRRQQRRQQRRSPGRPRFPLPGVKTLLRNLPLDSGLRALLAHTPDSALQADIPRYLDVVFGSIHILQDYVTRSRLAADPPDLLIEPALQNMALLEFNRAEEAIAAGRTALRASLDDLAGLLE
ncbi:patatin-like phospholipase family protein [Algihabitans albus]|uniref:patatin-like phospholipase family protein n=1 Tax=Algihabitans albus TaxID=2164067 RepID=UPI000E5C6C0C|nr:patatin-like phospholipase family protein [Algihabitans albus]